MTKRPDSPSNTLDDLNDHLARFFRHADTLLAEWKSYGERVRGEIDGEVAKLQGTVSAAVEDAGRKATQNLDGQVETSLGDGLTRLRGEVDRLTRLASEANAKLAGAGAAGDAPGGGGSTALGGGGRSMLTLVALVSANVMLAVLIALSARSCGDEGAGTAERPAVDAGAAASQTGGEGEGLGATAGEGVEGVDAGAAGGVDAGVSALAPVCEALAKGYDVDAAKKLIEAAAVEHCGEAGAGVAETVNGRLIVPKAQGKGKGAGKGAGKGTRRRGGK